MPSRKERLRAFMRLKSQRQMLVTGVALLTILAIALGGGLWRESVSPELVRLGKGIASVEAQPVSNRHHLSSQSQDTASNPRPAPTPSPSESGMGLGEASYYGTGFEGNLTANGEVFDPSQLTAAHRTLAMGSRVRVTNPKNGESVIVRINDRGPFHGNRVIDLSVAAAREIGLIRSGTGRVQLALIVS